LGTVSDRLINHENGGNPALLIGRKMNRKQLTVMWVGITLIVLILIVRAYITAYYAYVPKILPEFIMVLLVNGQWAIIVAVITVGLICTFGDKRSDDK
jgi:hypothetical protein